MGLKEDLPRRKKLRTDDLDRRNKIEESLKIIYNKGLAVDSMAVENLLREQSWVPTAVSRLLAIFRSRSPLMIFFSIEECILAAAVEIWL